MSENAILWLLGTLITLTTLALCGIAKLLIEHIRDCRLVHSRLAEIAGDVAHIKTEIGDRESGIRGLLHDHSGYHFENDGRFQRIEDRLDLPHWTTSKRRK